MSTTATVRLLARGAALAAFTLGIIACSSDAATSPTSRSIATTTAATAPADTATTLATTAPPVTVEPSVALQQGLAALAAGYHFSTVVNVNGAPSLTAEGDRLGGASRLTLTGNGGTVAYIITPAGSYAQPEGGDWSKLDVPPATSDAIVALQTPAGVTALPTTDGSTLVRVSVNAVALGLAIEGNVDVDVTLVNGVITQLVYNTPVAGGTAQVVTTVGPVVDATPIVAPI